MVEQLANYLSLTIWDWMANGERRILFHVYFWGKVLVFSNIVITFA